MMKPRPSTPLPRDRGFTLMELIIVISIMAVLAALIAGATSFVTDKARKTRTETQIKAIELGLEKYKGEYGSYPEPASSATKKVGNSDVAFDVGGARMLYQALTGDGGDAILGVGGSASNGRTREAGDGKLFADFLNEGNRNQNMVWSEDGDYLLIDPFGNPYQYVKFDPDNPGKTENMTYDLWSYGSLPDEDPGAADRLKERWIANFNR